MPSTPNPTDLCTCGHPAQDHRRTDAQGSCRRTGCDCGYFTRDPNNPNWPQPTPRKVIQIAALQATDDRPQITQALADDGTIWEIADHGSGWGRVIHWTQLPELPPIPAPPFHGDD